MSIVDGKYLVRMLGVTQYNVSGGSDGHNRELHKSIVAAVEKEKPEE